MGRVPKSPAEPPEAIRQELQPPSELDALNAYQLPAHVCTDNEALILLQMSAADISERFSIYVDTPEGPALKQILVAIDLLAKQGKITEAEKATHENFWIAEIQKTIGSEERSRIFAEAVGIGAIGQEIAQNTEHAAPLAESVTVKLQKILLRNFHHRSFHRSEKDSRTKTPNVLGILFSHHAKGEITLENTLNLGRKFLAQMHQAIMDRAAGRSLMTPMATLGPESFYETTRHILTILLENKIITEDQALAMLDFSDPLNFPNELREAAVRMMPTFPSAAREVDSTVLITQAAFQTLGSDKAQQTGEPAASDNDEGELAEDDFSNLFRDFPCNNLDEDPRITPETPVPTAAALASLRFKDAPDTDALNALEPAPLVTYQQFAEVSVADETDPAEFYSSPASSAIPSGVNVVNVGYDPVSILSAALKAAIHTATENSSENLRREIALIMEAVISDLRATNAEDEILKDLEVAKRAILIADGEQRHTELLEAQNGAADRIIAAITALTTALQTSGQIETPKAAKPTPPKLSRLPAFAAGAGFGALVVATGVWLSNNPVASSMSAPRGHSAETKKASIPATYGFKKGELEITYTRDPNKTHLLKVACDKPCKISHVPKTDKYPAYLSVQIGTSSGIISLPPNLPSDLTAWVPQTTHFQGLEAKSVWNTHSVALVNGEIKISKK